MNLNQTKTSVVLHRSLMPYVDWSSSKLTILYLDPDITLKKRADGFKEGNLEPSDRVTKSATGLGQDLLNVGNPTRAQISTPHHHSHDRFGPT